MTGRDAIECIVQLEREEARGALDEFNGCERYANALTAEAVLPSRRPEWVAWARAQAKAWRALQARINALVAGERDQP